MATPAPIEDLHPSQLLISARKLREVLGWFDLEDPSYEPLVVTVLEGELTIIDGHTRAFVGYLAGLETLRIEEVTGSDRATLNFGMYRECLRWCRDEDVTHVSDFVGRVVDHKTYERNWVDRCHASPYYEDD